jgi:predicted sulfurtransferase
MFILYSTDGIRCERATALLNQMKTVNTNLKPKGVYHCRGGIERYIKTFPEGGFWKGKNYLFDKRMEQTPDIKEQQNVENDIHAKCCLCRTKCTAYRGQFKCNRGSFCGVPVIVCESCTRKAKMEPESLVCELCREGYKAPSEMPDLVALKRKAEDIVNDNGLP